MERLLPGQKCYIIYASSKKPGMFIGLVKNVFNNQYIIEVFSKNNVSEIKKFDIISGKEVGENSQLKISIKKYTYTNPAEISKKIEKQNQIEIPPLSQPVKQISVTDLLEKMKNNLPSNKKLEENKVIKSIKKQTLTEKKKEVKEQSNDIPIEKIKIEEPKIEKVEEPKKTRKKKTTKKRTTKKKAEEATE